MPEKQEKLNFDFNQFTRDILETSFREWAVRNINLLYDARAKNAPVSDRYDGHKNEKDALASIEYYKSHGHEGNAHLTDIMYKLYSNPNIEGSVNFYNYWGLIRGILRYDTYAKLNRQNILLVLNKLSVFDEETQLEILKYATRLEELTKEDKQKIWIQIASNNFASAKDKADAAHNTFKPEIIRDAISALKQDLETELNKDFPNSETVNTICSYAKNIAAYIWNEKLNKYSYRGEYTPEDQTLKDYYDIIQAEFDTDKILELGSEYIPQLNQSLEERAIQAEQRAKDAEQRAKDAEQRANMAKQSEQYAINDREKAQQDLRQEQQKNVKLAGEMDKMQGQLNRYGAFVKALQMKMAVLKIGLFGKGSLTPEQLQEWVKANMPEESR